MCGIIGYIGNKEIVPVLLEGLHCLEYRGYDSTGIAIQENGNLNIIKSVGKLSNLKEVLKQSGKFEENISNTNGKNGHITCGIGHTRWATHGEPSDVNAHPHFDQDETIAVVHNGIIRNYQEVKNKLVQAGIKFLTDTDTEVIVQLIGKYLKETNSHLESIKKAVNELDGSYAIAILFKELPNKIYAVRKEAPLVIGLGENENFIASDTPTLSQFVDKIVRLNDNEIAEASKEKIEFYNLDGKKIQKEHQIIQKTKDILDKRGFKHYLAKEINEQADVISGLLKEFLPLEKNLNRIKFDYLNMNVDFLKNADRILILACGTAYHAGLVGKHVIEDLTSIPVDVQFSSEFLSSKALLTNKSIVIGISQSGETADTLAAIKKAISCNAKLIGITNRSDSALADLAKEHLIISKAGVEVSVAATKTFTAQMTILYLLGIYFAELLNTTKTEVLDALKLEMRSIPQLVDQTTTRAEQYQEQVIKYANKPDFVFIGRGINYPIALEAALKLKELSYIHASGYASGEMKHGPIAVLDPNVPVVSIIIPGESYDKVIQNSLEAKSRQAPMIAVAIDGDKKVESIFDTVLRIPQISEMLSPFLSVIPMQFLSYYIAEHLGRDVDQPRNLAKSVTVE